MEFRTHFHCMNLFRNSQTLSAVPPQVNFQRPRNFGCISTARTLHEPSNFSCVFTTESSAGIQEHGTFLAPIFSGTLDPQVCLPQKNLFRDCKHSSTTSNFSVTFHSVFSARTFLGTPGTHSVSYCQELTNCKQSSFRTVTFQAPKNFVYISATGICSRTR